jgi:hypothetical protein
VVKVYHFKIHSGSKQATRLNPLKLKSNKNQVNTNHPFKAERGYKAPLAFPQMFSLFFYSYTILFDSLSFKAEAGLSNI